LKGVFGVFALQKRI